MGLTRGALKVLSNLIGQTKLSEEDVCFFIKELYQKETLFALTEQESWDFISFLDECILVN